MAIKRTSSNSISNAVKLSTGFASAAIPNTPTIGTATATSDVAATVTYTAAVLGATASTFTATSNPGSVTGTGSSPITVTGLTASTAYTFTVTAGNANGTSAASSASNSITTSAPLNSYQSIATVTVDSPQATISFTSIPATFKHLQVRAIGRDAGGNGEFKIEFNSDTTTTNYRKHVLYGDGSSAYAGSANNNTCAPLAYSGQTANAFEAIVIDILDYANTNKNTTIRTLFGKDLNGSGEVGLHSNLWVNTAAVSNIDFKVVGGSNFAQYTQFALYGIKGS